MTCVQYHLLSLQGPHGIRRMSPAVTTGAKSDLEGRHAKMAIASQLIPICSRSSVTARLFRAVADPLRPVTGGEQQRYQRCLTLSPTSKLFRIVAEHRSSIMQRVTNALPAKFDVVAYDHDVCSRCGLTLMRDTAWRQTGTSNGLSSF